MRRSTFTRRGTTRRGRTARHLVTLVVTTVGLGLLAPLPAAAAQGELIARDGAFFEHDDAVVRIVLARRVGHGVSVGYRTVAGTAGDGVDFLGRTGRVFFPAGTKVKKVRITLIHDTADEPNEYFRLRLSEPRRATILDRTARVTILDDDGTQAQSVPTLSVADTSAQEGDVLSFTVSLDQVARQAVSFRYATSSLSAGSGDYSPTSGFGTIAAGAFQTTVRVQTTEDGFSEPTETLQLSLSSLSGATPWDLVATGTILDDDTSPQLRINDVSVSEGNSSTLTVTLSRASGSTTQVAWRTTDGTARANSDYTRDNGTLTIPAGATSGSIPVRTVEDSLLEGSEVFYVDLSSPFGGSIADSRGVVTILDDDSGPALTVADVTVAEPVGGTAQLNFTVSLSHDPAHNVSFTWATVNGSAVAPGDFTAVSSQNETITSGTTKTLTVTVKSDTLDEVDETLGVVITNVVGATASDDTAVGRILDSDDPPTISVADPANVAEGQPVTFVVTLSAASGKTVTVDFATADGTATQPEDYDSRTGTLTFVPGDTTESFTVTTKNDSESGNESFNVTLSNPGNATIADGTATATLTQVP